MFKAIAAAGLSAAFLVASFAGPASARPVPAGETITRADVSAVYPAARGLTRSDRFAHASTYLGCGHGRLSATARETTFDSRLYTPVPRVDLTYIRLANVSRARAVLNQYRRAVKRCLGSHTYDVGHDMTVEGHRWSPRGITTASVGISTQTEDYGGVSYSRTLAVRKGRTVVVARLSTDDIDRHVYASQALRLTKLAVRKVH